MDRKQYYKDYYLKNKNKIKKQSKKWYKENKEYATKRNAEWRDKNPDKMKNARDSWVEKNKKHIQAYRKKYIENNQDIIKKHRLKYRKKHWAKELTRKKSKRRISLIDRSCEKCGSESNLHRHHLCYKDPLDILILCITCHANWHKLYGIIKL